MLFIACYMFGFIKKKAMAKNDIIGWWSGGITSAVTCKLVLDLYGLDNCRIIFIDTMNEDEDTYRFKIDCEKWYGKNIETIKSTKHKSIQDVWIRYKALNNATGAVCSSELKRAVREVWEKHNEWKHQAFGFELSEYKRAMGLKLNHKHTKPIFPLMMYGYTKKDCINIVQEKNITVPRVYSYGYLNNNCFKTGCVQGGIGYWQKIQREFPEKFNTMAEMEHRITELKEKPITMLKDQSKSGGLVFLKHNKDYPTIKDITMMKGIEPKPLFECNGFCGTNDFDNRNETEEEINFQVELF